MNSIVIERNQVELYLMLRSGIYQPEETTTSALCSVIGKYR